MYLSINQSIRDPGEEEEEEEEEIFLLKLAC
jgi:hypothetical protein